MKGRAFLGLIFGTVLLINILFPRGGLSFNPTEPLLTQGSPGNRSICSSSLVRIMPLGDSITHGSAIAGGYRIPLWEQFLANGWQVDFVGSQANGPAEIDQDHEGHPGKSIQFIREGVVDWLTAYGPDIVLLMIGTNDVLYPQAHDFQNTSYRLNALMAQITQTLPEVELLVASIPGMNDPASTERAKLINAEIPAMVAAYANQGKHVHSVDMFSVLTPFDLADGVHPNEIGYEKMATTWYGALQDVKQQRCSA